MATPFTNQATLFYNGNVINSNITTGQIVDTVAMEKIALTDTYRQNGKITYVVTIANTGTSDLTDLILSDNLGEYTIGEESYTPLTYVDGSILYFVNGVIQSAPVVTAPLSITGFSVPANGNVTIMYETVANGYAPVGPDASITNTVSLSSEQKAYIATATETVELVQDAELSIMKSLSPENVEENGTLTYTFRIENRGTKPIELSDDVTVRDIFTPVLNNMSVTFNQAEWIEGVNYTYDELTGEFVSNANQITVPGATYSQDVTRMWTVTPGVSTLVISGTI
ncbi:MAG: hypothetical protein IJT23_05170 [Clostridia bacterium]|nr:hypothetical protein [Clostridia bacterium]